jgi:type I restriction enzyme M protein
VRLYRGENLNDFTFERASYNLPEAQLAALEGMFAAQRYSDIPGLCKVASRQEIDGQGWSLNPGRYVGVSEKSLENIDFLELIEGLSNELESLNAEAHGLENEISIQISGLLTRQA